MTTDITSKDYDRLYDLLRSGKEISCYTPRTWLGGYFIQLVNFEGSDEICFCWTLIFYVSCARNYAEFIQFCTEHQLEFFDPGDLQENRNAVKSFLELYVKIPGEFEVLPEERTVVSKKFKCNGEAMRETWNADEQPIHALFRLYKRARKAAILDEDD